MNEVDLYLSEDIAESSIEIMKYTLLKKLYERYNTALPSSASVERLFSKGGQIFKPTRTRLTDNNFEALLFLCANLN